PVLPSCAMTTERRRMKHDLPRSKSMSISIAAGRISGALYRTIWRWHFYAALFPLPCVALLATTGAIYLFKPQIDAWIDRPYDHMALAAPAHSLDDEVAA